MSKQDQDIQQRKATPIVLSIFSSKLLLRKLPILVPTVALCGLLALVSVFFASADSAPDTYAVDSGNQITTEVDGQYYVTLTTSDVNFSVAPSKNENAAKQRVDVGVETNVAGGAKLYLAMGSNSNSLHLNGNTAQSSPVIAAVADGTDVNNFAMNTWGYSTDDQAYSAVPTATGDPALLATVDGETVGSTSGSVISASVPVYYAAKVDTSIPAGSYSNRVTYSAVVDGGITTEATLTSIKVDGQEVDEIRLHKSNTILVTTNLRTNAYGVPRVYFESSDPAGYEECANVVVTSSADGYMTVQCTVTPTAVATGLTLHIVPKGSQNDILCANGTYMANSSQCEPGNWQWGEFLIDLPDTSKTISAITYMQDMTTKGCAASDVGDTKQLIDKRDGKKYWVAKLADGNCWMTQNLELELTKGKLLTPELSDVSSDWDPGVTTLNSARDGTTDTAVAQSWNLGKVVWKTPDGTGNCSGSGVYNFSHSDCQSYWQDVSSWTPMTEYRTDGVSYDASTKTYDAHYLAGNYYSWQAATAGTGEFATSQYDEASDSICPAGWHLPYSGPNNNSKSGSFYYLLDQYGLANTSRNNTITRPPLFFVRSGLAYPLYSDMLYAGSEGHYWSSIAAPYSEDAYYLHFASYYSVGPSSVKDAYFGFSVRCVAPST